jgi:NAD(P)-dependent dehydrogenase (short-subunit alcohol dehydrogenase family)
LASCPDIDTKMTSSKDLPPLTEPYFPKIFLKSQFRTKPQWPPKDTDLSNQVGIITGGNVGLGFESGRQLLSHKLSRLILAVRSADRGEAAAIKLRAQYPNATVEVWLLDMSSYDSIASFVDLVQSSLSRLDFVILNAGVRNFTFRQVSDTGHEEVMQVNYLSTVLLAILLLPVLKSKSPEGTPGRLTISNAALSLVAKFPESEKSPILPAFDDPKSYDPQDRYNTSKLLAHFFIYKLSDYVSAEDVVVNLVDPGFVKGTSLARDIPIVLMPAFQLFSATTGRTLEVGASTYVDAAVVKGKETHGCFLRGWQISP